MNVLESLHSDYVIQVGRLSTAIDVNNKEHIEELLDNIIKLNKIIKDVNLLEEYDT